MKKLFFKTLQSLARKCRLAVHGSDLKIYFELYPADSVKNRRFYNIGAGEFDHPAWTVINGGSEELKIKMQNHRFGLYHDLFDEKPLPFDDGSAELVYTSHTIEHVDNSAVDYLFRDVYRILKPGGIFRVVVPDARLAYEAWRRGDRHFYHWVYNPEMMYKIKEYGLKIPLAEASLNQIFLEEFAAQSSTIAELGSGKRITDEELEHLFNTRPFEQAMDYCISFCSREIQKIQPFRHMNWFDEKKLDRMLEQAGFSSRYRSGFAQSRAPVLRNTMFFDKTLPEHSIYMEAVR